MRFRWACLLILAIPAIASAAEPGLTISVNTSRPLAAIADEFERRYPIVVTYEEGEWVNPEDLELAERFPIMIPRKAAVTFHYPRPADGGTVAVADVLAELLFQYHAADAPGRFRLEGSNGLYHLIPAQFKDYKCDWQVPWLVLDTRVYLEEKERTINDTLDEIMIQLNQSSPVKTGWGFVPLNLFVQNRVRIGADGIPAREVLRRIVQQVPRRVTWRLMYDPTTVRYYLSFVLNTSAPTYDAGS